MTNADEVKRLASLARLSITEASLPTLVDEFESILAYIGQLESLELTADDATAASPIRNVFRNDDELACSDTCTERLIAAFPKKEGDALMVKQIIVHE